MRGFLGALTRRQMDAVRVNPDIYTQALRPRGPKTLCGEPLMDGFLLDRSWHLLAVLLDWVGTERVKLGLPAPESDLFSGDAIRPIEDGDYVVEVERLRSPEETRDFASFLETVSLDDLLARIDYWELMEYGVFAEPLDDEDEPDEAEIAEEEEIAKAEVTRLYAPLREYVRKAAAEEMGLLSSAG